MWTGETDAVLDARGSGAPSGRSPFADIPDPLSGREARPTPAAEAPAEPSPTRAAVTARRAIAFLAGAAAAIGLALVLGLRDDLAAPGVLAQVALWTLAVPAGLALALRPRAGGFPAGVTAVRVGLFSLAALFVGLAVLPVDGIEVPLRLRTVRFCVTFGALAGLPALIGAAIVLRRSFLNAPALRAAFVGALCGLAGSISIHAHCPVASVSHVLVAHGLPVVVFGAAGALLGALRGRV